MKFINKWSYSLAHYLAGQLGHSHEKRHVYYYGFQIIIGGIVKFVVLLLATLVLGIFLPTFTVLMFFALPRITGGGYHMTDYTRCMLASSGIFMSLGFLVKYTYGYWSQTSLAVLAAAVLITAVPLMLKYAPADTPYKPITKESQKKVLKILSVLVVVFWAGAEVILIASSMNFLSLSGSLGILMAVFIISPAGYKFFDFIGGKGPRPQKAAPEH